MILFSIFYAIIHCFQDWFIWRGYKWLVLQQLKKEELGCNNTELYEYIDYGEGGWHYWEDSKFYATIGFDQLLHFITIMVLYNLVLI